MFNNKEFNAKLSVKLTKLVKTGSNATILKQLINGTQNAVTVGIKSDNGVIAAINTKYASGNPEALLKLAQGDSLTLLSKGYKTLANGKTLSKGLSEDLESSKLELVKASALYALAKGEKNAAADIIAAITAHKEETAAILKAAANAEGESEGEGNTNAEGEGEGEGEGNTNAEGEGEGEGNTNSLDTAAILATVNGMDAVDLAALKAAIAQREAALQAALQDAA